MILDRPPKDWKRPATPCKVKLQVLINQCGRSTIDRERLGTVDNTHFDHRPPLEQRKFDTDAWDTVPPANDPAYIEAITVEQHDIRTNGPGGTKRIHSAGSDAGVRGKTRRLATSQSAHRATMKAKASGEPRPERTKPKAKIPGRPLRTGRKFPSRKFA